MLWRLTSFSGCKVGSPLSCVMEVTSFGGGKVDSPLSCVMEVALLIDLHVDCGVAGAVRCRDRVGCR